MLVFILFAAVVLWTFFLNSKISNLENTIRKLQNKFEIFSNARYKNILEKKQPDDIGEIEELEIEIKDEIPENTTVSEINMSSNKSAEKLDGELNSDITEQSLLQEEDLQVSSDNNIQEKKSEFAGNKNSIEPEEQEMPVRQVYINEDSEGLFQKETAVKDEKSTSFENFFIGNIFNIIGAIAIIIGCGIFVKLIQPYIIFTPLSKTLIGLITGTAMVIGGCCMKKDTLKRYSEIVTGTGFAVLFIIIYCSAVLFKTFPFSVCSIFAILILLVSYYLADKQKTFSLIAIALTGGYSNIFLVSSAVPFNITFIYLIFLNLLSIIFVFRNPEKSFINVINIFTTFLFGAFPQAADSNNLLSIVYPAVLWLIYLAYDFIMKNRNLDSYNKEALLNPVNLACLFGFSLIIFREANVNIGCMLIITAIIYSILTAYLIIKKSDNYKQYLYLLLVSVLAAVYYITDELVIKSALWSIIAVTLSYITLKYKTDILKNWLIIFLSCALTNLFFIREIYYTSDISSYIPIFNIRLLAFIFPLSGLYISSLLISKLEDENSQNISAFLKFGSITLLYLFIIFELNDFINIKFNSNQISYSFIKCMLYSIIGFKYAIQMKRYEMITGKELYNYAALIIFTISILTLLVFGFVYKPAASYIPVINIRFIAYAAAIYSSVLFLKWTKLNIYKYIALILGFILMTAEIIDCMAKYGLITNYIISIMWILYVGIITTTGIFKDDKVLKNTGIWISFLTIGRIFLYDLANIEMIYKLIIFVTLGTIFMLTSYFYNKNKK